ncbi:MAG: bifunctional DNA-formamidopyrimidine glycosylase/DNA-(apurinic or apyrimidinic site) lyase [Phycisphaerales bacterium]|nr:bifunctional DNA-formamidopyrimidine glycosylase/DNA-(apurinic or apyrimidinic site) lyase [Phycisphaerales bacterium]
MPELPEVESIRLALLPHLVGSVIRLVSLARRDIVRGVASRDALLDGQRIVSLIRHGKQLAIVSSSGRLVIVRFGMTGQLLLARDAAACRGHAHVHVVWRVDRAHKKPQFLLFRDPRRFGGLYTLRDAKAHDREWSTLGPDAISITGNEIVQRTLRCRVGVKAFLLNQRHIAGVGNIYADEALFRAGIHPRRRCETLDRAALVRLAAAIRRVLKASIDAGGSTLRDHRLPDGTSGSFVDRHQVYGRAGHPCLVCGATIHTAVIAGRTTCFCLNCQPRRGFGTVV